MNFEVIKSLSRKQITRPNAEVNHLKWVFCDNAHFPTLLREIAVVHL